LTRGPLSTWDSTIALAYADENLCLAAQFLTTNLLSLAGGVAAAYELHVPYVVQHGALLPPKILARLQSGCHAYANRAKSPLNNRQLQQLRTDVLVSRDETRAALNDIQQKEVQRVSEELRTASMAIARDGIVSDSKQLSRLVGDFKRAVLMAAKTRER
jgi:hypothetical protein